MTPDTKSRQGKLRSLMKHSGLDSVLITNSRDIQYYTGLMIPDEEKGFLIIGKGGPRLLISPLLNMFSSTKNLDIINPKDFSDYKSSVPEGRMGFDDRSMSVYFLGKLKKPKTSWIPFSDKIKEPRIIKDDGEISLIKKAIGITESVIGEIDYPGKTESLIALEIETSFREKGASKAFETIIASGKNSALIHYTPTQKKIKKEDLVIIDCGARFSGYCSDMTRTFCKAPGEKEKKIHAHILEIQNRLKDYISEGVSFSEVQKLYESLMKQKGFEVFHSFGHGVGLAVHERPTEEILRKGMVFTIEPGIYKRGFGGVRIEDMFVIENKKAKPLSNLNREL